MLFGPYIPMKSLAAACRGLSTMLHSGIDIQKVFDLAAEKMGNARCRAALLGVADRIRRGDDVATAMRAQQHAFPPLMIDMVSVAEQSGAMPEILEGLADHYENNLRLWRNFLAAIAWPMIQLIAAILVIAFLIFILGWIAETRGGDAIDFLGLGLSGSSGALIWLSCTFGTLLGLFAAYQIAVRGFAGRRFLDPFFLRIPVLGTAMRSFAIARFSWAFYLTQQTGMPIHESLDASLRATGNGAFLNASPMLCSMIKSGETLSVSLRESKLFPEDFLHMVEVAETSGTVPEALHRLSPQFEEQARRSLTALSVTLAWVIWMIVAGFIIYFIFRVMLTYLGMIQDALNQT